MSSNVDDLPYGHLREEAEAMTSVLQQFFVGKEEHSTLRSCWKEFRQDEDFGIHVTAKDNTERVQPITHDAKHGSTRKATASKVHQLRSSHSLLLGSQEKHVLTVQNTFRRFKESTLENACVRDLRECKRVVDHAASISTRGIFLWLFLGMMQSL